jgi:hypothetical protein
MVGEGVGKEGLEEAPAQRDFFAGRIWERDSEF